MAAAAIQPMNRLRCCKLPSPRVPLSHRRAPIARGPWRHGQESGPQCCGEGRNRCGCGRAASTAPARQRVCAKIGDAPPRIADAAWSAPQVARASLCEASLARASRAREGDQYQVVEITGFRFPNSGESRSDQANRQRCRALAAFQQRRLRGRTEQYTFLIRSCQGSRILGFPHREAWVRQVQYRPMAYSCDAHRDLVIGDARALSVHRRQSGDGNPRGTSTALAQHPARVVLAVRT